MIRLIFKLHAASHPRPGNLPIRGFVQVGRLLVCRPIKILIDQPGTGWQSGTITQNIIRGRLPQCKSITSSISKQLSNSNYLLHTCHCHSLALRLRLDGYLTAQAFRPVRRAGQFCASVFSYANQFSYFSKTKTLQCTSTPPNQHREPNVISCTN